MDPMEYEILLEEAIREARSGPIAPAHDTDDVSPWSSSVQYAHCLLYTSPSPRD